MKSCNFSYYDPNTVSEVVSLISRHENAKILAGGLSLVPMLNIRIKSTEHIVDLNKVSDLFGIKENGNHLSIGSMTRQSELLNSPLINQSSPLISKAFGYVGHDQTRNRGTIGGSLCHLDPAAELCIVASAYNAELTVTGKKGDRVCLLYTSPSPRDATLSRMPSSA